MKIIVPIHLTIIIFLIISAPAVCQTLPQLDVEGNINISNAGNFLSARTSGVLQNILTIDGNDDVVINRGSIINGLPSHVLIGLGENKRFLVRNSLNNKSIFIIDEATGNIGITDMDRNLTSNSNVVRRADGTLALRRYEIGDIAHGGIVFWVDETGEHGLVAATVDQSVSSL